MIHFFWARAASGLALFVGLGIAGCGSSSGELAPPRVDTRSSLTLGPCVVAIADPATVCGTLTVPEERSNTSSRLIGLPFAIIPAKASVAASDPVVIFTGGPGPSSLRVLADFSAETAQNFPLRQARDVIVMTQRGTDLTTPQSLDCRELALDFAGGERFATDQAVVDAAKSCRDRLVSAGVKLGSYTTKEIARDMEDLRLLLGKQRGFTQWNVVGSSYGSKLALAYMRDAPQGVRSAVLDGPLPLQDSALYTAGVLDALTSVLTACNQQADCAAAFPGLQARFAAALVRLQATPAMVDGTAVRGDQVLNAIRGAFSIPQAPYGLVPLFMERVAQGDLKGADQLLPFLSNLLIGINPEGMRYTVTCTDEGKPYVANRTDLPIEGAGWPDAVRLLIANEKLAARTCPLWTEGQKLTADARRPLKSDIPTLITVGQFDASTPATRADALLPDLSNARKVVFTARGHALLESDECMLTISAAFVADPKRALDTSCIDAPDSVRFVTPTSVQAQQATLQSAAVQFVREQPLVPSLIVQVESPSKNLRWRGAAGVIDRTGGVAATAQSVFRVASITKTFTSAAVHRLAEKGRLSIDDPIANHLLPETKATLLSRGYAVDAITVAHLLSHTSGIPDYVTLAPEYFKAVLANPARKWTRQEQLKFALDRFPKQGEPGKTFSYSDTGYNLLGEIIEVKTGMSLGPSLRALLDFDRLGLSSTWMEFDEPVPTFINPRSDFARPYGDNGADGLTVDASADTFGGGGLVSSVGDLNRFIRALFEGQVVSPQSLASMQTRLQPDSPIGRGLFFLPLGSQVCWGHDGNWGGAMYYCPDTRDSVTLSMNLFLLDPLNQSKDTFSPFIVAGSLLKLASLR